MGSIWEVMGENRANSPLLSNNASLWYPEDLDGIQG